MKTLKDKLREIVYEDLNRPSGSATVTPEDWTWDWQFFYKDMEFILHLVRKEKYNNLISRISLNNNFEFDYKFKKLCWFFLQNNF